MVQGAAISYRVADGEGNAFTVAGARNRAGAILCLTPAVRSGPGADVSPGRFQFFL